MEATLRFIINGGGRQIKPGSFKDFEKLLSGGGGVVKINDELGIKYKREETKLGLDP